MGSRLKKKFNKIFPTEIISEILTRLPTESVLESKLVCKKWMNLIQHSSFPQMHLARLNHPDSIESGKLRYVYMKTYFDSGYRYKRKKHLTYFEFNDNEDWNYAKPIYRDINFRSGCEAYIVIGSFNGLICIYGNQPTIRFTQTGVPVPGTQPDSRGPAIIFNPVTKEYVVLPEFDCYPGYKTEGSITIQYQYHYPGYKTKITIQYHHLACGFGYLPETNEYKVVRIYELGGEPDFIEVEVYTVGSCNGWRHVGKFGFGFPFDTHYQQTHGVFLNGCLHWRNTEGGMVVVFDLVDEKFRDHISPPPMLMDTDADDDDDDFPVIGVSGGGYLYYAVCHSSEGRESDGVWLLMKENEPVEHQLWSWIKVASLDQREPFAFLEGGTVLRYDQGNVKKFLSSTSTWENLENFSAISRQVYPHKHTLVSLKELGEENVEIMKSQQ